MNMTDANQSSKPSPPPRVSKVALMRTNTVMNGSKPATMNTSAGNNSPAKKTVVHSKSAVNPSHGKPN